MKTSQCTVPYKKKVFKCFVLFKKTCCFSWFPFLIERKQIGILCMVDGCLYKILLFFVLFLLIHSFISGYNVNNDLRGNFLLKFSLAMTILLIVG